ncbi:MAG TPA: hypothetical protein VNW51_06915, partial [Mucilaginibacter sp.]|nr:hypothetical protein [Mucilaginibacter sp.]
MPLIKSTSKQAFNHNVSEMIKAGHPRDQALAASYSEQREAAKRAFGGGIAPLASQAFNPVMSPMPQTPASGVASGVMPPP